MNFRQFVKNKINKLIAAILAALFMLLPYSIALAAEKYPVARGAVNDFANVIDADNLNRMEAMAREVLQKTGTAVVVATIAAIGENEEASLYANGLYKAWGIGKKGEDKGVLIFLAVKERKVRIETGYGVEGILPDGLVGEILDKYVVPQLKAGNYGKALYNAMYACSAYIAKDAHVQLSGGSVVPSRTKARTEKKGVNIFAVVIFLIIAALLLGTRTGRSMLPWILLLFLSGGGRGGGSGGFSGGFGGFGGGGSGGGGTGRDF
jgi:uncharacterized protein